MQPQPISKELSRWCERQFASRSCLKGDYFRLAGPRYTTAKEIISGVGGQKSGGRWNAPGFETPVVYLSQDIITAAAEAHSNYKYYDLPPRAQFPKALVLVGVALESVLDLTAPNLDSFAKGVVAEGIEEDWRRLNAMRAESTAQAMGAAAYRAGFQGILVPSHAWSGGKNVVVFRGSLRLPSAVWVQNDAALASLGKPT